MKPTHPKMSGFTLIEVMIVVAIVGILAAIAYPSYQDSVRKSWRANAAACLSETAQAMERRFTTSFSYAGAVPVQGCQNESNMLSRYAFSFAEDEPTAKTFILQAVPVDPGPQAGDSCGTLTLSQSGQKGADAAVSECWRR